jgi:hypothetical protein
MTKTEHYVNKYKNLPKKPDRVVVCFSVDDKKDIKPFIKSILDQTIQIDDIGLTIPEEQNEDSLPSVIKKILSLYKHSKDYDDANTLVCSVLRETEGDTKIIILEPNMVYGEDFIQTLIEESEKNPDNVIHVNSENSKQMLVKPRFFTDKISGYQKGTGCLPWLKECQKVPSTVINYSTNYKAI